MKHSDVVTTPVAIVGAGVSGLALAGLLHQLGIRCEIFERTRSLATVGAGIQLAPNGVRVLQRLGLGEAIHRHGVEASSIETRRWKNASVLARTALGAQAWDRYSAPYYLLHRADLQACLLAAVPAAAVHLNKACRALSEADDLVEIEFGDGTRVRAAFVVGADGAASTVRGSLIGDKPRYSGHLVYRGLVPSSRLPALTGKRSVLFWFGPDRHVTYYPISSQQVVHFSAVVRAPDPGERVGGGRPARVEELLANFDGWHRDVLDVLSSADRVNQWGIFDYELPDSLGSRRIALVGDAAHLMLPYLSQGANQALEDVTVLADLIASRSAASGGFDPDGLIDRYDQIRLPRLTEVHSRSRDCIRRFHLHDGPEQQQRDSILARTQNLSAYDWLYGSDPAGVATARNRDDGVA